VRIAGALRRLAVEKPVGAVRVQQRQPRVVQGGFDELATAAALALLQGQQYAKRGV